MYVSLRGVTLVLHIRSTMNPLTVIIVQHNCIAMDCLLLMRWRWQLLSWSSFWRSSWQYIDSAGFCWRERAGNLLERLASGLRNKKDDEEEKQHEQRDENEKRVLIERFLLHCTQHTQSVFIHSSSVLMKPMMKEQLSDFSQARYRYFTF